MKGDTRSLGFGSYGDYIGITFPYSLLAIINFTVFRLEVKKQTSDLAFKGFKKKIGAYRTPKEVGLWFHRPQCQKGVGFYGVQL